MNTYTVTVRDTRVNFLMDYTLPALTVEDAKAKAIEAAHRDSDVPSWQKVFTVTEVTELVEVQ